MKQIEKASVQYVNLPKNRRIVVVSDIHGHLDYLQHLLLKIDFSADDILVLLGDMVEKGPNNLKTLRYIMELQKSHTVYPVCGNCESIWNYLLVESAAEKLLDYLLFREASLVNEMAKELGISIEKEMNVPDMIQKVKNAYEREFSWLKNLPQIVETEHYTFVHAGIDHRPLAEQGKYEVMTKPAFYQSGLSFDKYCIVGHWPTCLYDDCRQCCNPIIDKKRKIISIDGANILKRDGQLNALIIPEEGSFEFCFDYYDDYPRAVALDCQKPKKDPYNIIWSDNKVEVMEEGEEISLARQISTGHSMKVLNDYLYRDREGRLCCEDMTDDELEVRSGEEVAVIAATKQGYFIKKQGYSGWYFGRLGKEQGDAEETHQFL